MEISNSSSSYSTGIGTVEMKSFREVRLKYPPKVFSPGFPAMLLEKNRHKKPMDYSAQRLEIQMAPIFLLMQTIHSLLKNLGLPMFVSQILVGIILGPMVFPNDYSLKPTDDWTRDRLIPACFKT